jgi:hypothetical protein
MAAKAAVATPRSTRPLPLNRTTRSRGNIIAAIITTHVPMNRHNPSPIGAVSPLIEAAQ